MLERMIKDEELREKCQRSLLEKRILFLADYIEENMIAELRVLLLALANQSTEEVTLYIDSTGGDGLAGEFLSDLIRTCGVPVKGIVNGKCESAAIPILQACHKRLATKNSLFLLHRGHFGRDLPGGNEKEIREAGQQIIENMIKSWKKRVTELSERTGRTFEAIEEKKRQEKDMSAEEAKEFGLIDEVI